MNTSNDSITQYAGNIHGDPKILNLVNLKKYGNASFVECDGSCCGSGDCGCQGDCSGDYDPGPIEGD